MAYDIRTAGLTDDISVNHPRHLVVTADLSTSSGWETVASHEVFTVTGVVRLRLWQIVTETVTSGGSPTIQYGFEGSTDAYLGATAHTSLTAGKIWYFGPAAAITAPGPYASLTSAILDTIEYNSDIGYEILVAATTNGTIEFHCIWEPLTAGASVVAGAGGTL